MKPWTYLTNVFLRVCKHSYKIAYTISTYHDAQLEANQSDPFFGSLYHVYHPLQLALTNAYSEWQSQSNQRTGSTLTMVQMLALLSPTKSNYWKRKVLDVYDKDSSEFKTLFPSLLKPFYGGTTESRIAAVKTLAESMKNITELAETYIDVKKFYIDLVKARSIQLGNKGATSEKSIALENIIRTAMVEMYSNLGALMIHFKEDPMEAALFFDLATIRSREQLIFRRSIQGGKEKNVLNHTFAAGDTINVINDGNVDLLFYLAPRKKSPKDGLLKVIVNKNTSKIINMSDLDLENPFLNIANIATVEGHCIVELM